MKKGEDMRLHLFCVVTCLVGFGSICVAQNGSAPSTNPCAAKQQQELDFWLCEWDLTWPGANPGEVQRGTNSIRRVLEGCVIEENFSGGDEMPLRGKSVSVFDTRARKWKQTWVDNQGAYLDFVGEVIDGQMILGREVTRPDGSKSLQRMVFKNISKEQFDWSWEASKNGGKNWQVVWPIHYRRRQ
jgi:hypothetical protein